MSEHGSRRPVVAVVAVVAAVAGIVVAALLGVLPQRGGLGTTTTAAITTGPPSPVRLESFSLESPLIDVSDPGAALEDGRTAPKVNVLLPEGYDDRSDERYPVLWLLHGAQHGADGWLPGVQQLVDGMGAIVVMADGGLYGMYADWWSEGSRTHPAWSTFHLGTLREELESRYRIRPQRRWHAIAGISMGGQGALRYAALLPGYFGSVATFSAAMPDTQSPIMNVQVESLAGANGDDETDYASIFGPIDGPYAEGNNPRALVANLAHTRMFLTSGDGTNCPQDPVDAKAIANAAATETVINGQQGSFAPAAVAAGADVTATTTCGVHTFGVWDRALLAAREWGFFEPAPVPTDWDYRTVETEGEVWGLRFEFSSPPTSVVTISRRGGTVSATGTGTLTVHRGTCRVVLDLPASSTLPPDCRP